MTQFTPKQVRTNRCEVVYEMLEFYIQDSNWSTSIIRLRHHVRKEVQ